MRIETGNWCNFSILFASFLMDVNREGHIAINAASKGYIVVLSMARDYVMFFFKFLFLVIGFV